MGIIGRAADLISAKSSEWFGNKEKNNAGAVANKAAEDFQKDTAEFTNGAAEAIAQLEQVKDQKKAADADASKWHNSAVAFLKSGNQASASQALDRENQAKGLASKLQAQIDAQQARIDNYKQKAMDLQQKAGDAKNTAAAVQAQEKVVSAEEKIKGVNPDASLNKLKQAEADVTARERKQDAINDMDGSNLEAQADKLDRQKKNEDAMAALKAEVEGNKPATSAPANAEGNIAK